MISILDASMQNTKWPGGPSSLEAFQAWRQSGPGAPLGLKVLGALKPFGCEGTWGLEALQAWKHCGAGSPSDLEALWVCRPFGPVTAIHHLNYYPFD